MTAMKEELSIFEGWTISGWSLEHELLRVRFHFWPEAQSLENADHLNEDHEICYRGEGLFTKPSTIAFENFCCGGRIKAVSTQELDGNRTNYQISSDEDALVEIVAKNVAIVCW